MTKLNSEQNSYVSDIFRQVNSKFDDYACSSYIFNSAGLYIVLATIYSLVSSDSHLLLVQFINFVLMYQQSCNIYILINMMLDRTQALLNNPCNNLYELTKLTIFVEIPLLNLNIYDIFLVYQYFEVLRLYWLFKNIMEVFLLFFSGALNINYIFVVVQNDFTTLQSQFDSILFIQYPIRIIYQIARSLIFENVSLELVWFLQEIFDFVLKIFEWSQFRCYVFNATK